MKKLMQRFIEVTKSEFPLADVEQLGAEGIHVSQKTNDDPSRESKRFSPIIISLHEDFATSEFAKRPLSELCVEFSAFIHNKRSQFNPRTTDDANQSHTVDTWIFPPEC
jgi:hypothetical protein